MEHNITQMPSSIMYQMTVRNRLPIHRWHVRQQFWSIHRNLRPIPVKPEITPKSQSCKQCATTYRHKTKLSHAAAESIEIAEI